MEFAFESDNGFVLHIRRTSPGDSAFQPRRYICRSLQPNRGSATHTDQPSMTIFSSLIGAYTLSASTSVLQSALFGRSSIVENQHAQPVPSRALSDKEAALVVRMLVGYVLKTHASQSNLSEPAFAAESARHPFKGGSAYKRELPSMSDDAPKCSMRV